MFIDILVNMLKKEKQRNETVSSPATSDATANKSKHFSERNLHHSTSVSQSASGKSKIPDDVSASSLAFLFFFSFAQLYLQSELMNVYNHHNKNILYFFK